MSTRTQRWHHYRSNLPTFKRFILSFTNNSSHSIRNDFASRYIINDGYEIGAQSSPLTCKNAQKTVYIDYLSKKESAAKYNIPENECVDVDILTDANNLSAIPSESASFIIANHVLEHCKNPIATLIGWLRILQTNGILFLTLPNYKSNEFDFEKTPTSISHLAQDYEKAQNNEDISTEHIFEHIRIIDGIDPGNTQLFEQRYKAIVESNLHTHYHVFNKINALGLLHFVQRQVPLKVINSLSFNNSFELIFIIKKIAPNSQKPMIVRRERLFNLAILAKHIAKFLFKRISSKR